MDEKVNGSFANAEVEQTGLKQRIKMCNQLDFPNQVWLDVPTHLFGVIFIVKQRQLSLRYSDR